MKSRFDVKGMTCSACQAAVNRSVKKLDGVKEVNVNLMTNSMDVYYDENKISNSQIEKAVEDAGYSAKAWNKKNKKFEKKSRENIWQEQIDDMVFRLKISVPFMLILMYVAMGHMVGLPIPHFLHTNEGGILFGLIQFLIALPVVIVNKAYYTKGFKSLFKGYPNMDSLISIGSTAALLYGIWALLAMSYAMGVQNLEMVDRFRTNLYFESAAMILTLVTLGKYFETKSKGKTSDAITRLMDLAPKKANLVVENGDIIQVEIEDLKEGDILQVRPGESVPADGIIISGNTSIDESAITGESIPVEKKAGDKVTGATINKTGSINFKATKVGNDTALSKIIELVQDANATKAPIESLADKISGIFVPVVIIIATITFIVWFLIMKKPVDFALELAISVLVISCPCALGLATPVAVMVATGKGAEYGILFKSSEALEKMQDIDTVVFDKTGTLSEGYPVVKDVVLDKKTDEKEFYNMVYALEKNSEQPLAEAVVRFVRKKIDAPKNILNFKAIPGKGVSGLYGDKKILGGNKSLMSENIIDISSFDERVKRLQKEAKTPMYFAQDGKILGIISASDKVKNTSSTAIKMLKDMEIESIMLTGDNEITANAVSSSLGIEKYIAGVLPADKDKEIQRLQEMNKKVAMVGDGINDAPSLARADVGIAIGTGTDIAIESADVVLMNSDPQDVSVAADLSKKTLRNIKQNLFWAFFYNIICIPLAAGVFYIPLGITLSPMIASAAMGFSSLFVLANSLRLRGFRGKKAMHYERSKSDEIIDVNIEKIESKNITRNINMEDNKMAKIISIEGMMCQNCVKHVAKALKSIGANDPEVILEENIAKISEDIDDNKIKEAIKEAGYEIKTIE